MPRCETMLIQSCPVCGRKLLVRESLRDCLVACGHCHGVFKSQKSGEQIVHADASDVTSAHASSWRRLVASCLLLVGLLAWGSSSTAAGEAGQERARSKSRPNVIVVVSDDLGYGDLGFQGGRDLKTPHLDALAKGGARFTNAYVTGSVCGPTRAGLVSGRYQQRHSYDSNPRPAEGLNLKEATLADVFRANGYATGAIGKWHLGQAPEYRPERRGFDEFFGFYGAMHAYIPGEVAASARMTAEKPRRANGVAGAGGNNIGPGARPRGEGALVPGAVWNGHIDDSIAALKLPAADRERVDPIVAEHKKKLSEAVAPLFAADRIDLIAIRDIGQKQAAALVTALQGVIPADKLAELDKALQQGPTGLGVGGAFDAVAGSRPGFLIRGTKEVEEPAYLTEAFGREAIDFVARHKESPFFLYLCFNASHSPLQPPQKYLDRFPDLTGKRQAYAATTAAFDDAVGALVAKLLDLRLEENTLLYYTNDNGGPVNDIAANNAPLGGVKASLWEGGIRVPSFVYWKGRVSAGVDFAIPVTSLDIFPTVTAAAGLSAPAGKQLDGVNLLPSLTGTPDEKLRNRQLFWRAGANWAIREGDWKLVKPERGEEVQLFNLAADIAETRDLSKEHPEVVERLAAAWKAWDRDNLPASAARPGGL